VAFEWRLSGVLVDVSMEPTGCSLRRTALSRGATGNMAGTRSNCPFAFKAKAVLAAVSEVGVSTCRSLKKMQV
jgi:hypothetical protein